MWSPFVHAGGHCRVLCAVFCFVVLTPGGLTTPDLSSGTHANLERLTRMAPPLLLTMTLRRSQREFNFWRSRGSWLILVVRKENTHGKLKHPCSVQLNTSLTNILQYGSVIRTVIYLLFLTERIFFVIPFVFPVGDL